MKIWRAGFGLAAWGGLCLIAATWMRSDDRWSNLMRTSRALFDYARMPRQEFRLESKSDLTYSAGDGVFVRNSNGEFSQVGQIVSDQRVQFYPSTLTISGQQFQLVFHRAEPSLGWLIRTVLPPRKQEALLAEIRSLIETRGQTLLETLRPILAEWNQDLLPDLEQDLGRAIADHWSDIDRLARRWGAEIDRRDLDRLMREVCWPIVQTNVGPLADKVGVELWARVSLWRFGWRYLYDQSGLGDQAVRREWDRFVREEVTPVLESHTDEFLNVLGAIASEIAANDRVQRSVGMELKRMLNDPEFQGMLGTVLKQTLLDNPRLRDAFAEAFTSPEARRAIERLSIELEPTVDRIGVMIFGSADAGIDPDFARAIRGYVLGKDRQWYQLVARKVTGKEPAGKTTTLQVVLAEDAAPHPLRFLVGGSH